MSQSLSNVLLHIIFSTKDRYPFIDEEIQPELYAYIISTTASYGSYVHKIGGVSDHIHLFTTLPRTLSISELLEVIKKNSSKWIKTKEKKYHDFSWQKGFGVFSVSASQHDAVVAYITNQKEHHKIHSYQEEYRQFLQLHKISYDETFVWD
ncbi:MAG: IS200/IS605 family transposase [Parachlamydiaceae bacterium]|nr:IS200/IS605 family transposase [Parachlamydiaceae bacterium]